MKISSLFFFAFAFMLIVLSLSCSSPIQQTPSTPTPASQNSSNTAASTAVPWGYVDEVTCSSISGWAVDRTNPANRLEVSVFIDGQFYMKTIASMNRSDIAARGYSDGNSGWVVPAPASIKNGQPHKVTASVNGTELQVPDSNQITCPAGP